MDPEWCLVPPFSGPPSSHCVMGDGQELPPPKTLSLGLLTAEAISCLLQPPWASGINLLRGLPAGRGRALASESLGWCQQPGAYPSSGRKLHASSKQEGLSRQEPSQTI